MSRAKNLRMQGSDQLAKMYSQGKGTKKHVDKQQNQGKPAKEKIYVHTTLNTYQQGWGKFCAYLETIGVHTRELHAVEPCIQPFIDNLVSRRYSAYTIHTWVSAVVKVLELSLSDYKLPTRSRKDIKRSRGPVKSDARFSPAEHPDVIDFSRSVGPRSRKELAYIRGTDLVLLENGRYAVHIRKGKGGKERFAPIYGPESRIARVVEMMNAAGDNLLFPHIPCAADIHSYRAEYACEVYSAHARPIHEIPREDRYICRKDLAGTIYDKKAMMLASEALGHSRLDVIAQSYLWALRSFD